MWRAVQRLSGSLLLGLLVPAAAAASASTGTCSWRDLTPTGFRGDTYIYDVAAASPFDAWAVGETGETGDLALILHWDGNTWRRSAAVPNVDLRAVAAVSPNDAWAVGQAADFSRPVTMHWNGVRWRRVSSPRDSGGNNFLNDVVALGANDVWAVGNVSDSRSLAEHWNGRAWRFVPTPRGAASGLLAIDGRSSHDLWTVGSGGVFPKGTVLRWTGTRWVAAALPAARFPHSFLHDVAAVSASRAWAIGTTDTPSDHPDRDPNYKDAHYTLEWNGVRWANDVAADRFLGPKRSFHLIAAGPSGNAWALASDATLARRTARAWEPISWVPFASKQDADIRALEPISGRSLWVAGTYWDDRHKRTSPAIARALC